MVTTTPAAATTRPTEKAEAWSGIRDIDVQIGEAAPGQQWPGGPYRTAEWVAIAVIAGPTLWWVDSHPAGTTLYALGIGVVLCVATVVTMRMLLPKGRPSLSTRAVSPATPSGHRTSSPRTPTGGRQDCAQMQPSTRQSMSRATWCSPPAGSTRNS